MSAFIAEHLKTHPIDPADEDYQVNAGPGSIIASKRTPIYRLHGYDSKKPVEALAAYINHFTKEGELVLDPFVGSGMTAIAALQHRRKCIAIDASPLATFITANSCRPVDVTALQAAARATVARADALTGNLYLTRCGYCHNDAAIYATIYSQTYQCRRCQQLISMFDALVPINREQAASRDNACGGFNACCPVCAIDGIVTPFSNRQPRRGYQPVMLEYRCNCRPGENLFRRHNDDNPREAAIFHREDLTRIREIAERPIPYWYPTANMMRVDDKLNNNPENGANNRNGNGLRWGLLWRRYHEDIRRVDQFFTPRNLTALSALLAAIGAEPDTGLQTALQFIFSAFLLSQSRLQRYHPNSTFPNMIAPGLLYIAPMIREYNVFHWYLGKTRSAARGFDCLKNLDNQNLLVSTQSAGDLSAVPDSSIDYILTDPPYSGKIQYGELNFIQEAWLNFQHDWREDEIIINAARAKDERDWADMMRRVFSECFRVLRPGRWLSLCYHDSSQGNWTRLQNILAEIGFICERRAGAVSIDALDKSLKQHTADKTTKRDLVFNFRKPATSGPQVTIDLEPDQSTFRELSQQIIRDYLIEHPGATKDRIYDELVAFLFRAGKMEAHNFERLLSEIAIELKPPGATRFGRWYLKQ